MSAQFRNPISTIMPDEELREELERYRALCEVTSEAIVLHEGGVILDVNEPFCRMFGYEVDEVIGRPVYDFAPSKIREAFRETVESAPDESYEGLGQRKNGSVFPLEVRARTVQFKGRQVRVAIVRDLTEQKRAEAEVRQSREAFQALLDSVDAIVWEADIETFCFNFISKEAERLLGYSLDQWYADKHFWEKLIHPEDRERAISYHRQESEAGRNHAFEYRMITADERVIWMRDIVTVVVEKHKPRKLSGLMLDITKRKEAELELRRSRQRYQTLMDSIDGIVWEAELDPPRYTFVSRQVERLLGFPVERWLEDIDFWLNQIHPDDREQVLAQVDKAVKDKLPFETEYRIFAADGRLVWLRGRITVEVENDEVVKVRGITVDDTERRLAEERMRKSHQMLIDSQEIAHWGSFELELDDDGNIKGDIIWSDELYRIYGLEPQERKFTLEEFISFFHPEDREDIYRKSLEAVRDKKPFVAERRIVRPDGKIRYLITRGSPVTDERGRPVRIVGATHDLTERREIEEALRASEQRYRAFIANSSEGILRYDFEPPMPITLSFEEQFDYLNKHAILGECNETGAEILGFPSVDSVVGLNLEEILKNRGESGVEAVRQFIRSNYYLHEVETSNEEEGEKRRYFRINFVGTVEDGKLIRAWGTQREVTARKRTEKQLAEYSEQLRALSARVNLAREEEGARIAREIHDELGTALTGLRWDLEWIERKLEEGADKSLVQAMSEKLKSMNKLIVSTVETVRRIASELHPKLLDDLGLITAIEWQAQQVKKRTGLDFIFNLQVEEIDLDQKKATAVFRIFQEILTNIQRHANATRVEVCIEVFGDDFVLTVKDDGRGITERDQTKKKSLGLLGMRERAFLVGGSVAIMGQEGKGTTVVVRVPIGE